MAGYTRQSSFADGDTITAALFNNEYNQLLNAFAYSSSDASATGHRHDGSAAQGGNIGKIGDLDFLNKIKVSLEKSNGPLIIFPQGTRVLPGEVVPFKKGVGRIYDELKINCQPVAINSGNVWPKNGKLALKQTIIVSILPAVKPGMNATDFTSYIENKIYSELNLMN